MFILSAYIVELFFLVESIMPGHMSQHYNMYSIPPEGKNLVFTEKGETSRFLRSFPVQGTLCTGLLAEEHLFRTH